MSGSSATLDVHDKLMSGSYFLGECVITVFIVKCFDNLQLLRVMVPFAFKVSVVTVRPSIVVEFKQAEVATQDFIVTQAVDTVLFV